MAATSATPIDAAVIIAAISRPVKAATGTAASVDSPPVNGIAANDAARTAIVAVLAAAILFDFLSLLRGLRLLLFLEFCCFLPTQVRSLILRLLILL